MANTEHYLSNIDRKMRLRQYPRPRLQSRYVHNNTGAYITPALPPIHNYIAATSHPYSICNQRQDKATTPTGHHHAIVTISLNRYLQKFSGLTVSLSRQRRIVSFLFRPGCRTSHYGHQRRYYLRHITSKSRWKRITCKRIRSRDARRLRRLRGLSNERRVRRAFRRTRSSYHPRVRRFLRRARSKYPYPHRRPIVRPGRRHPQPMLLTLTIRSVFRPNHQRILR